MSVKLNQRRSCCKLLALLLCSVLLFTLTTLSGVPKVSGEQEQTYDMDVEEFYRLCNQGKDLKWEYDADINDDFVENELLVVIKKEYSEVNKVFTPRDFPEIPVLEVEDL